MASDNPLAALANDELCSHVNLVSTHGHHFQCMLLFVVVLEPHPLLHAIHTPDLRDINSPSSRAMLQVSVFSLSSSRYNSKQLRFSYRPATSIPSVVGQGCQLLLLALSIVKEGSKC